MVGVGAGVGDEGLWRAKSMRGASSAWRRIPLSRMTNRRLSARQSVCLGGPSACHRNHVHAILLSLITIPVIRIIVHHNNLITLLHSTDEDLVSSRVAVEHSLLQYMHQQRLAIINESSVVHYTRIYDHFFKEATMTVQSAPWREGIGVQCPYDNETIRDEFLNEFTTNTKFNKNNNTTWSDVLMGAGWGVLCCTVNGFLATGGIKKHVLVSTMDSNWGEFSDYVPNRTVNWGSYHDCNGQVDKYYRYLNHPNVSLVVTIQHQHFDHPKVLSVPLGQQSNAAGALQKQMHPDDWTSKRSNLLLINCNESPTRKPILQRVIANFNGEIKNKYNNSEGNEVYFQQLSTSKYILSPSGLGWDCYRTWEALILGCIPILETYYRRDGLYRTYNDLPVLWVDHYDNVTPSLLESEYPRILSKAKEYQFEKLTTQWWIDLINSHRSI